ncbi:trifunctional serine/threonine-protein kinase/ATP-binding protein/sensor histidine kinase [Azospirillum humicireducens]|uniref:trifunctional serine/threonine-protein kinase/ATP-binding protein/sensor histidine kinase n=1 Tax=Azospirillum humicireducens TaxID=1226968 RepID=UPI001304B203|nr:AAA family ATPase [Azospirillum humicireducens]
MLATDGSRSLLRLTGADGASWLAARTGWANEAAGRQFDHELSLKPLLGEDWALVPLDLRLTRDGPALLYPDDGGQPLSTLHRPPLIRFLEVAAQAAAALGEAHRRHLQHGALQPQALMLAPDGRVRLTGFETGQPDPAGRGETGRRPTAYTAPETAGPDGQPGDERSDLYALGIVLFGLLTGRPPLTGESPAQWLHAHMAVQPPSPSSLRPDVPPMVDALILKLIAKAPDDRYQSAASLADDLTRCLRDWSAHRHIPSFELARSDRIRRLAAPAALLGREEELGRLGVAYDRAAAGGRGQLVFVGGAPGSGKSALVADFMRHRLPADARIAAGKTDQYQPAVPYAPVLQALRRLAAVAVAGPLEELEELRAGLAGPLDGQLALFLHLLPEFEPVTGPAGHTLDDPSSLQPLRIRRMLTDVLQAFARPGAPVLLFLDDLQWADEATLAFIRAIADTPPPGLMAIAAYRDTSADIRPGFGGFLTSLRDGVTAPAWIALPPIGPQATAALVAAVLDEPVDRSEELLRLIGERTGGNPLHILQLLRTLADDGTLRHDAGRSAWTWTDGGAALLPGGDTVTDLLVVRLRRLAAAGRNAMRLLACIGSGADDRLLAAVAGLPPAAVQAALAPAAAAGLVLHGDAGGWTLVHDRVQEAAYGLTPEEDRPAQHAAIASAMLDLWPDRGPQELFRIAAQIELSFGAPLCAGRADAFAGTLIDAAGQAVAAAARGRALTYLAGADRILGEERWTRSYPLAWRTAVLTAECQLASGDAAGADRSIDGLFRHADGAIDGAEAYRLKAARLTVASDFRGAVRVALDGLALLGIDLPADPPPGAVAATYDRIRRLLDGRPVSILADLPPMDDPRMEAAMALLTALEAAYFYPAGDLVHLQLAIMVELTLTHGVTAASAQGIAWFGVSLATVFDKYEEGFAYASVALELVDRHGFERYRTPVLVALDQVGPWTQPLSYGLAHVREAKKVGHRSAELRMLCYSCNHIVSDLLAMGERLSAVREETDPLIAIARDAGFDDIVDLMSTQQEYVLSLQEDAGRTVGAWEAAFLDPATAPGRTPMSALYFWTWQLRGQAALYHRDFALARASLAPAFGMTWAAPAHISVGELTFYNAVLHTQDPGTDPAAARDEVAHCRRRLALWAGINPLTFRNKLALVDAETARLDGRDVEAMRLYDDSAAAAAAAGFSHEQALAHELAGRHARSLQLGYAARDQLRLAMAAYRRWGALAKVKGLEAEFPFLAADGPSDARHGIEDPNMELVLKTAHALSEEILLDRLVERLMTAMIVHAGARRGSLLLMRGDEPRVEATATLIDSDIVVRLTDDVPAEERVPAAVLHTVLRTRRTFSSGDAATAGGTAGSFLCQPLIKQGRLVGVLYLENDLALNVFTPRKAAMLEVLAPQAANALEAARLYTDLMLENRRRQEMEAALRVARADLARASHLTVMGELAASITHEISQPLAGIVASAGASLRWLKAPTPDVAEALSNLEDIRTAGLRVADILRALRALAKQAPLVLEPLAVDPLVEEVLTLTADEIGKRGVHLTADLRGGGIQVRGDRTQLQQVVLNLVTNALDSMAGHGGARELLVESRAADGVLAVSVTDTGSGISPDILARIFDPFFTTKDSGMGMGLSICRSVMSAHGGTLSADSGGGGSRFTFTLPIETE